MLRKIAAGLLIVTALFFWFGPALGGTSGADSYDEMVDDALATSTLNNTRTEVAPQQQVVNGWVARDLLEIQARQNNDILTGQNRLAALLAMTMIGAGLLALDRRSPDATPDHPKQLSA